MRREIVLVRHGRSTHHDAGWIDIRGFVKWRRAYETAGIVTGDAPPRDLVALAARAGSIVASDLRRAIESAERLAPGREVVISSLLRERVPKPPALRGFRLPLIGWALAYGVRWLYRQMTSRRHVPAGELQRADDAARWLDGLASKNELIVVVTHASFRPLVAMSLEQLGWSKARKRGGSSHWSAWTVTKM